MDALETTVDLSMADAEAAIRAALADATGTRTRIDDPRSMMPDPAFADLARDAAERLGAALAAVGSAPMP